MTKDFADFLGSLNREGAAYVVIEGIAVLAHVPYRTTRDLDILIEPSRETPKTHGALSACSGAGESRASSSVCPRLSQETTS